MNRFWPAFIALLVTGCATPIGEFKEEDFIWREQTINANYQEVYRRVLGGLRRCGALTGYGNIYTDISSGHFDMYVTGIYGPSQWVVGVIDIKQLDDRRSHVRVGVNRRHAPLSPGLRETRRQQWIDWTMGRENNKTCGP